MQEMVGKIHAAVDARRRTQDADHRAHRRRRRAKGLSRRSSAPNSTRKRAPIFSSSRRRGRASSSARSRRRWATALPLMANMVEGGQTPILSASELEALGFRLVIFPGGDRAALARAAVDFYGVLKRDGTTDAFRDRMFDFEALNGFLGTADMLERGRAYESGDADREAQVDDRARSSHARRAEGAPRADRRRNGRDALSLGLQSDHRRSARRLPRPLSRGDRRDPGAGLRRVCRSLSARWRSP